jgi:hypothetical protein
LRYIIGEGKFLDKKLYFKGWKLLDLSKNHKEIPKIQKIMKNPKNPRNPLKIQKI